MRYEIRVVGQGSEGRVRHLELVGVDDLEELVGVDDRILWVSRNTFSYCEDGDGNLERMPEQWFADHMPAPSFEHAVKEVLETQEIEVLVEGDQILCCFEGRSYEWVVDACGDIAIGEIREIMQEV